MQSDRPTPAPRSATSVGNWASVTPCSTPEKRYAHLGVSELWRLRQLEEENSRLKRLVADLSLDKHMLSKALRKKVGCRTPFRSVACGPVGWHSSVGPRGIDRIWPRINPPCGSGFWSGGELNRLGSDDITKGETILIRFNEFLCGVAYGR
jgi:hypothetical protein